MENKNNSLKQHDDKDIVLNYPRALWLEFLLTFFTLGFYSCLWFVARAKEFDQLLKQKFTPWMWFFAPLIPLILLFSFPVFIRSLNKIEREYDLPEWNGWWGAWTILCFVTMFFIGSIDKIELPGWTFVVALLIWSILMAVLQSQVIKLKKGLMSKGINFTNPPKFRLKLWEWVVILPLIAFALFSLYYTLQPVFRVHLKELKAGTTYTEDKFNFTIPIQGSGWSVVEKGTFSEDDSAVELQGPFEGMFFVVFDHGKSNSLNDLSEWRIEQYKSNYSFLKCNEERKLANSHVSVNAYLSCKGLELGDSTLLTSSFIETSEGTFELYGYFSAPRSTYLKYAPIIRKMAKGFEPK